MKNSKHYSKPLKLKILNLEKQFEEYSNNAIENQSKFLSKLRTTDLKTGEVHSHTIDLQKKYQEDFLYFKQSIYLLNHDIMYREEEEYTAFFYTSTLSGQYHIKTKNFLNKGYNPNLSINDGYNELSKHHRAIYKDFKINNKNIQVRFILVFEPHSDYTPHAHAIYYVKSEHAEAFKSHIKRLRKNNENIGKEFDLQEIEEKTYIDENGKEIKVKSPIKYLLKYVEKNLQEFNPIYHGWKLKNKIRTTRNSKTHHMTKLTYKKISKTCRVSINYDNFEEISNLYGIEKQKLYNTLDFYNKTTSLYISTIHEETGKNKLKVKKATETEAFQIHITRRRTKKTTIEFLDSNLKFELKSLHTLLYQYSLLIDKDSMSSSMFSVVQEFFSKNQEYISKFNDFFQRKIKSLNMSSINFEVSLTADIIVSYYKLYNNNSKLQDYSFFDYLFEFISDLKSSKKHKYSYLIEEFQIINCFGEVVYDIKNYETYIELSSEIIFE